MAQVSIITASYNYENYIKETIDSVINQTFKDWEMIIVDDGSKDNSVNVIKEYCEKDDRIRLYQHEGNLNCGLIETLKLGLSKANTEWIIFLESDDSIEPNYIEEKLKVADKYPEVSFIFNEVNMFGDEKTINSHMPNYSKRQRLLSEVKFPTNLKEQYKKIHTNLIPTFSCMMLKKSILSNIDFDSPVAKCLDMYICLQLAGNQQFYYLREKLTNWRMHKDSYISRKTNDYNIYKFEQRRIEFLYPKTAKIRKIFLFFSFIRKNIISIHLGKNRNEIIILGKKIL